MMGGLTEGLLQSLKKQKGMRKEEVEKKRL
jgi:hypothetical protein